MLRGDRLSARCKACLTTVRGGTRATKQHRDQCCPGPSAEVQRQAVKRRRRKSAASRSDEPSLTPPHRLTSSANAVGRWSGSRHGTTATFRAATVLAGAGAGVSADAGDGSPTSPPAARGPGQQQGRGALATGVCADDSCPAGSDDGGCITAAHGDVATRWWAVGVRAAGGPEAVAAALRARYPRLYSIQ